MSSIQFIQVEVNPETKAELLLTAGTDMRVVLYNTEGVRRGSRDRCGRAMRHSGDDALPAASLLPRRLGEFGKDTWSLSDAASYCNNPTDVLDPPPPEPNPEQFASKLQQEDNIT